MIISALLCLDKYSLFAKTLHPATRCSMLLSLSWHTLQCPSWTNSLAAFYDLVSTICSSIDMIEDVFLPCKVCLNQRWYSSFVLGRIDFAAPLSCSFWFSWIPLLSANKSSHSATLVSILFLHLITSSSSLIDFHSKRNLTPPSSIILTNSTSIAFPSLIVSPCSFNPSTGRLNHVAGDTCLLVRIPQRLQSYFDFLSLQVQSFITCLLSQHVLSWEFSLNCLIQFLKLTLNL